MTKLPRIIIDNDVQIFSSSFKISWGVDKIFGGRDILDPDVICQMLIRYFAVF